MIQKYGFRAIALCVMGFGISFCAHNKKSEQKSAAYQNALNKAFAEIQSTRNYSGRGLASTGSVASSSGANFSNLRGSIELVVFPKYTNATEKNSTPVQVRIGRPLTYKINIERNLNCQQLIKEKTDKWMHQTYFANIGVDKSCAILRMFQSQPEVKTANLIKGDTKEVRMYIDSDYGVYGIDHEIMRSRRDSEWVNVKTDSRTTPGASGLGLIPLNLPPISASDAKLETDKALEVSNDPYLKRKLMEMGVTFNCTAATRSEYKDVYGNINRIQWCKGDVWPTVVENANMITVLKRGK